jgi:hypothetical protein
MMLSLIYSPLNTFLERIPIGRILNRLTNDTFIVDNKLTSEFAALVKLKKNIKKIIFIQKLSFILF